MMQKGSKKLLSWSIQSAIHKDVTRLNRDDRDKRTSSHKVVLDLRRLAHTRSQIRSEGLRAAEKLLNAF